jgi:hypothetical protein
LAGLTRSYVHCMSELPRIGQTIGALFRCSIPAKGCVGEPLLGSLEGPEMARLCRLASQERGPLGGRKPSCYSQCATAESCQ